MVIKTDKDCRAYVEAELDHLVRSRAGWHAGRSVWVQAPPLSWTLGRDVGEGWYTLEARVDDGEFLIWFGNHQVGAEGLHWIVRPAVHVAFADLWPRSDPLAIRYTLSDVLDYMIASLDAPRPFVSRFELNTESLT